jgi:hypothetical protein
MGPSLAFAASRQHPYEEKTEQVGPYFYLARERETLYGEMGWSISPRNLTLPKKSKVMMAHRMLNNVSKGRSLQHRNIELLSDVNDGTSGPVHEISLNMGCGTS